MVEYDVTDSEYLFWVQSIDRQKALQTIGAKWDSHRACWVLPRTRQVCIELRAVFGKEAKRRALKSQTVHSTSAPKSETSRTIREQTATAERIELEQLRKELQRRTQELDQLRRAEAEARSALSQQNAVLGRIRSEVAELRLTEANAKSALETQTTLMERLRAENAELRRSAEPRGSFTKQIKDIAFQAAANSKVFAAVLNRLELTEFLSIRIKDEVEGALGRFLEQPAGPVELTELIKLARSRDVLGAEDIDLLYLIRDQRNAVAHPRGREKTLLARAVISLLAAAVVWPRLSP
jgi:hypothetical protein